MGNISHLEQEMGEMCQAACSYSVCFMVRWQREADLSQDTQICVLQMYSEGHSPAALQQAPSFKFNNNSFMQNMRQSELIGKRTEVASRSCSWLHRAFYNNIHWDWSQWESCSLSPPSPPINLSFICIQSFSLASIYNIQHTGQRGFLYFEGRNQMNYCFAFLDSQNCEGLRAIIPLATFLFQHWGWCIPT